MKKTLPFLFAAALLGSSPAIASDIGLDLNVHLGNRSPTPIIVAEPPLFLAPPTLGFQVAVGVPYDMFLIGGRYYLSKDSSWYISASYGGPWTVIQHERLPPGLAKRRHTEIIALRDEEYRHYKRDHDHYKGKTYRPNKEEKAGHSKGKNKKHND